MEVFTDIASFRAWRKSLAPREAPGFVPTMGALHAGHIRLVEASRAVHPLTAVSIFVNPLQFGPSEDFTRYPRPLAEDLKKCREAGVAAVLAPEAKDFYAPDHSTYCEVAGLDKYLDGPARPGHFRGVCTVVLKLFHIVQPARAYFGQKDIQQALILRKLVRDLSLDLELEIVETVREPSGLALSSRNIYLSEEEKSRATALYRGLQKAKAALRAGETSADALRKILRAEIEASQPTRIDYAEVVSQSALAPLDRVDVPAVAAVAVFYGKTRLIDNILL